MIVPHKVCADTIDLLVVVRDVWTFSPSASASRSGGDDSTSAGFTESNLLGSGQRVATGYFDDADRSGHFFSYRNPLLPARVQLNLSYTNASDGESLSGGLVRPFYQLNSHWSGGVDVQRENLLERIEVNDQTVNRYRLEDNRYEAFVGWSPGVKKKLLSAGGWGSPTKRNALARSPTKPPRCPRTSVACTPGCPWNIRRTSIW